MAYADESVRQLLRREGFRFVSGRPEHPRGDAGSRAAFRSGFRSLVTARLRSALGARGGSRPVEVRFQDEARVDRKGMTSRLWACRGMRPRVVRDRRDGYRYLFGAARGGRGKAVGLGCRSGRTRRR